MQKIRIILITFFIFCFSFTLFAPALVSAANLNLSDAFKKDADKPLGNAVSGAGYTTAASPETIVALVIQTFLSFIGVIFLILMVYAGFLWMTAHGNEEQVTKAKSLITAAIIGLIIVVSAYAISYFVVKTLGTGTLSPTEPPAASAPAKPAVKP